VQDVEEQRLQHIRRIAPTDEVEGLEVRKRKRVIRVVEEEAVLPMLGPAMEPFLELTDDLRESGKRALFRFDHIHVLNSSPELTFFPEVEPVPLTCSLDQHPKERKQELQVLLRGLQREWIDAEVAIPVRRSGSCRRRFP